MLVSGRASFGEFPGCYSRKMQNVGTMQDMSEKFWSKDVELGAPHMNGKQKTNLLLFGVGTLVLKDSPFLTTRKEQKKTRLIQLLCKNPAGVRKESSSFPK